MKKHLKIRKNKKQKKTNLEQSFLKKKQKEIERLNSTKPLDELREREAELKRKNKEDQAVIETEDTSPFDREAAQARVAERNEKLERLAPQVAEREKGKPLRERIKERIKKHGFTVVAVVAAVSITIETLISKLTSGVKSVTKDIKDGIKTLGDKISSILPGLLGAIVKFV